MFKHQGDISNFQRWTWYGFVQRSHNTGMYTISDVRNYVKITQNLRFHTNMILKPDTSIIEILVAELRKQKQPPWTTKSK